MFLKSAGISRISAGIAMILIFLLASVLAPIHHVIQPHDDDGAHCTLCAIAATPIESSGMGDVDVSPVSGFVLNVDLSELRLASKPLQTLPLGRAPPDCFI